LTIEREMQSIGNVAEETATLPISPPAQRGPHELNGAAEFPRNELRLEVQHAPARALECAIPPRIPRGEAGLPMVRAVHLHDEALTLGEEIHDEAIEQDNLPPKLNALDLPAPERGPQHAFRP
jgi:hypothetical protein